MSNREFVLDVLNKLPEDPPINEIIRQTEFVAGVKEGLEQSEREEGISIDEIRELIKKWTSESSS